jgi:hypothetical protein
MDLNIKMLRSIYIIFFFKTLEKYSRRFVKFNKDSAWNIRLLIVPTDKVIIIITYDDFTFNVNDGKC